MTQIYRDPVAYLNDAVTKRGKSGPNGVYLHNVTVVAEATTDYGYKATLDRIDPLTPPSGVSFEDWAYLLIGMRSQHLTIALHLNTPSLIYQFLPEGSQVSMNIFVPRVDIESFSYLILESQETLKSVADFSGKIPTTLRFNIGITTKTWGDMVESGDAQEVEYSY